MSWWQKKLLRYGLRYGLSRTGLLEDKAIDLDNLDITIGKQNVIELKDIALNLTQISKLAQLPPSLRLETARVLSLRLTIPADFYQSSILAEVDGVELEAKLEDGHEEVLEDQQQTRRSRPSSPVTSRTPQHRKTNRRISSPPPPGSGGLSGEAVGAHIPTTQEVAKSFLLDEPLQERRDIEAIAAAQQGPEQSFVSESSEGDDVGTGMGVGVPGFLASFLQGIVDRFKLVIRNVQVTVETEVRGDSQMGMPVAIRIAVHGVDLYGLHEGDNGDQQQASKARTIEFRGISMDLLSKAEVIAQLSTVPSRSSLASSKSGFHSSRSSVPPSEFEKHSYSPSRGGFPSGQRPSLTSTVSDGHRSMDALIQSAMEPSLPQATSQSPSLPPAIATLDASVNTDHFADARESDSHSSVANVSDLDIQPGDDNISWGSRRNKSSVPAEDLWKSMSSEDDLPDSLLFAQPERAPTPRAMSSRSTSPFTTRKRRAVSPYDRNVRHPGSWPRPEGSPERLRIQSGHGSWPNLDQSRQSAVEPLDEVLAFHADGLTDNQFNAFRSISPERPPSSNPEPTPETVDESLLQSQVFSHEQAQSMYMSAMFENPKMDMPGGWSSEVESDPSISPKLAQSSNVDNIVGTNNASDTDRFDGAGQSAGAVSGNATPRAQSPQPSSSPLKLARAPRLKVVEELLRVDTVTITVPMVHKDGPVDANLPPEPASPSRQHRSAGLERGMPGTFSAYADLSASKRNMTSSVRTDVVNSVMWNPERGVTRHKASPLEVIFGTLDLSLTWPSAQVLHKVVAKVTTSSATKAAQRGSADTVESDRERTAPLLSVQLQHLHCRIKDHTGAGAVIESHSKTLVEVSCGNVDFESSIGTRLRIGTLQVLVGGQDLLNFGKNEAAPIASSTIASDAPAVSVTIGQNRVTVTNRPVFDVSVETTPVSLTVDLTVFEETFSAFGGLSGMLELSNSVLAENGTGSPISTKPQKGVRFVGEPEPAHSGPEIKLNARIGAVTALLRGTPCSAMLRTSTVKLIYREHGAVATVERVVVSGPHHCDDSHEIAPVGVDLATLRLEYLLTPQDKDLERLLSLITPSRDPYDDHGDILIDTLLRQRRKGSLLRAAIGNVKARLDDWNCLTRLTALGQDLSKLSAVTKYLPEDDRPGLLTLLRLKDVEARLPVNERFGDIKLALQDLHLAHVGLPALLAFSVGALSARQAQGPEVLHPMLPLSGSDDLPVVMARMLGGEMEPTVKVKLFNICLEYSVPVIVALTGIDEAKPEELVNQLAQSVANLTMAESSRKLARSPASDHSSPDFKKTRISLLVHDSAIGLTPQKLPSKAVFVLTDAHVATVVPPGDIMKARVELRKASIFVTDQSPSPAAVQAAPAQTPNVNATQRLGAFMSKQGYASVGSIMSAVIDVQAKEVEGNETTRQIEVDVKNELFLLETCADSTQTLFATLGALIPPTPPSKVPKYLTQPVPIEDMLQSFSGDPFVQPEHTPETLFDIEQDPGILSVSAIDEVDDLLAESEMTRSLYGPHRGVFGMANEDESETTTGEYPETAESLLEEDPFEMTAEAADMHLGDAALMRDLNRQRKATVSDEPVEIGLYEIDDLGFDALGSGQQALGTAYRFNAPFAGKRGLLNRSKQTLPFRLRLRDFHLIWHLYDGYDWQRTRDGIVEAVEQVEQRAEERKARRRHSRNDPEEDESVIGDFLFNSIYIGVPADVDAQEIRRQINRGIDDQTSETESIPVSGISRPTTFSASAQPSRQRHRRRLKLGRSRFHKIAFELKGVSADVLVFPSNSGEVVSSVDLRLKDFEIFDKVPTSTWRKFLTHMNSDPAAREMSKPMFHIQLDNVKTLESFSATEMILHVTVLPLRLHVDQDALDFITRFFEFKDPLMVDSGEPGEKPFLQRIEVDTVDLCLDYKPKNVDYAGLRSGRTKEFMNFITLEGCNIRLKHAIIYGLRGFDLLHDTLSDIWTPDVTRNQLPKVLSGLAPVRNLANLGIGLRDVVAIPVREYQKDGRIVRSIQKGATHFGKTTASELARLGAKVALGTQTMLSNAEELLAPGSDSGRSAPDRRISPEQGWHDIASDEDEPEQRAVSAYANQPLGVLAGLKSARRHLEHDLLTARDALIAVQGEVLDSSGPAGVAGAVVRHAPTVILRPVIGTARAVGTTLLGVGNQIDRGNLRRVDDVSCLSPACCLNFGIIEIIC